MHHLGKTKDKVQRDYFWEQLTPGYMAYMVAQDISAIKLSRKLGLSQDVLHKCFAGMTSPSWESLAKFEEFYRSEIGELPYERQQAS